MTEDSSYKIFPSSEKVKKRIERNEKYPFKLLEVGQSFAIPKMMVKDASLRNHASIVGRRLGRKFTVIDHGEQAGYEVARVK